jgi:cell wall-associated NlpC family hydrolase
MMNNKSALLTGIVVLLLAGCSASASLATNSNTTTSTTKPTHHITFNQQLQSHVNTAKMKKVIKYLKTRVERTSYVFSGSSPSGWDCSGLVRWTYKKFGIVLPHSANKQAHLGARISNPKLGDIVVFAYNGYTSFYHSAIYIGNGKIINANYGSGTTIIQPLTDYKGSQIRFVRVIRTD